MLILLPVIVQVAFLRDAVLQAAEKVIEVRIEKRRVIEPQNTVRVVQGETVTLRWRTDEKLTLHLHGYDLELDVESGSVAEMRFVAAVSGRFPITSHGFGGAAGPGHAALLYIEIYPG